MKILIKTLAILSIIILLGFAGCKGMMNHIYNRTDCMQFNIDNIELRTGIDIPAVSDVVCDFKESERMKVSVFTLEKASLDLTHYIDRNNFVDQGAFYVNAGEREDTKWNASLNKENLELTVELEYR